MNLGYVQFVGEVTNDRDKLFSLTEQGARWMTDNAPGIKPARLFAVYYG